MPLMMAVYMFRLMMAVYMFDTEMSGALLL